MFTADQADIDPSNPANWREPKCRYDVRAASIGARFRLIEQFDDADLAKAFVLNTEHYLGADLSVIEVDEEFGDETRILCAEWDGEDVQRYLEA